MKTLVLLDAHALIHRAYHALPKFTSKKTGEPTGALYGLSTMLLRVIREFKPDYIAAAFDGPEKTFRHAVYKDYKAKRPKADDELIHQLQRARDVVGAFGISVYSVPGFEADDVLGTMVKQVEAGGLKIIIVSGDMDTLQLVDGDKVVVYTMRRGMDDTVIYNEERVKERFGFGPELVTDFKGLKGDPSDNIVGVRGIGEKTATDIIRKFGDINNLYSKLESGEAVDLKERTVKLLLDNKKDALFSKDLATIRRDAPVKFNVPKTMFSLDIEKLKSIFEELGFDSLVARIDPQNIKANPVTEQSTKLTNKSEGDFWQDITSSEAIFLMANQENLFIRGGKRSWVLEKRFFKKRKDEWQDIFRQKPLVSIGAKSLIRMLSHYGTKDFIEVFDCGIAAWVIDSAQKKQDTENPMELVAILPDLYKRLKNLISERKVEKVFYEIETPLIFVLADMEERGISVDKKFLTEFKREISEKISKLEKDIFDFAGKTFNINSPSQVGEVLFDKLDLKVSKIKKTKTGKISTKESELLKFKDSSPLVKLILDFRELSKLLTTYAEPLLELATASSDGKVHTTFNQTGTVTGRLSSEAPNMQNIPIRSDYGARIRDAFVASSGYTLASFDYSQIELRILAAFAEDEKMIEAFNNDADIHKLTAALINNVSIDDVTPKMRSRAKAINFGIIYGMGVTQLARNTGMGMEDAKKFYQEYFNDFPRVRAYINSVKQKVKAVGYVETLFGRKRWFDLAKIGGGFAEAEMERMAVNAIIQGTDADIVKLAMIAVHNVLGSNEAYPLLQVHDELLYEIRDDKLNVVVPKIIHEMQSVAELKVRLSVSAKTGKRLGSMQNFI